ncbi:MAG: SusC/RagA family TonB-linked outer membrane protein [Candidatus Pseudobacter hemicellulosilyticus]|uniref:SusC/RagA family TonB-linked outer membrane protein n=1 Tax=Candidatus Pseudobacter hemicellulosilyticus TaxID=3121375 RepID=A0AAJ6BE91_9BACT|nr:MAG: SusC/RagA family TonB-linked outer membrane protein [Pseudobacter sp.]
MRLTAILLFVFCLHVAAKSTAQTVTFSGRGVSLEKVFGEIERQTGYFVVWKYNQIRKSIPVTISVNNMPVNHFLEEVFREQPLDFSIENQTIFIRQKAAAPALAPPLAPEEPAPIRIQGRVTDEEGKPLAGVSVQVKGRSTGGTYGASTNANGQFSIAIEPGEVIQFSYIGFKPMQVQVRDPNRTQLNITMIKTVIEMTDVVVSGFQDRKKSVSIGSVAVATAKDLENTGITTFDKALAGRMPGVYIRSTSGRPGETGQIIIRGINTLTGNVEPLYVLDGMPLQSGEVSGGMNSLITNGIGNIPPENIESITILKDATAASIYGSRAANGVIVITTKNGKIGNDYINYSGKFGVTMRPENTFSFMNAKEKVAFERSIREDYWPPYEQGGRVIQLLNLADKGAITHEEAEARIAQLEQTNTDWIKELYRIGKSQSHNISFSGGNTKTTYFASLNFQDMQGSLIENKFQTGGINMKLSRFVTDKLLFRFNLYTTMKKNVEGQAGMDPFKYAVFANPYEKPYNEDGSYAWDNTYRPIPYSIGNFSDLYYSTFNIVRELRDNRKTNIYGNIRGQFTVEYDFLRFFKYTGNVVASYTSVHDKEEAAEGTYRSYLNNWLLRSSMNSSILPEHNRGYLLESTGRTFDYTIRNTLEFNNTFGKDHFVQAFFANEFGAVKNDQFNHFNPIYLQDYAIAGYPSWDLVPDTRFLNLDLTKLGGSSTRENRSASFIGSMAYAFDNRYVFNGNIRYDGVDIIGSDNQFSPLWSAGVRWNAHNEAFLKNRESILSRLVLSVGHGYRGSINRSVLPFHTYTIGSAVYANIPIATGFDYGNPVIKWEKKKETNLGLELSLFKGRFNTELRYFNEEVTDLLDNTRTPPSVGRTSATINVGNLTNRGYEISVRVEVVKNKNWLWEVSGNFTNVVNKLTNVFEKDVPTLANIYTQNIQDYPVNSWFGYKFSHVDPETGSLIVKAQKKNDKVVNGKTETTYEDALVNLSNISVANLTAGYRPYYLGHNDPESYGGFNTRLTYKAFELTASFVYAEGSQILSFLDRREGPSGVTNEVTASRTNRLKDNLYRWRQPGDITNIPVYRAYGTATHTSYLISTDIESGAYLKCNEMAVSWRAPRQLLGRSAFKTVKATLVAMNVFTLSEYSGTDAETKTTFGYPNTRNYTLSLTVGF